MKKPGLLIHCLTTVICIVHAGSSMAQDGQNHDQNHDQTHSTAQPVAPDAHNHIDQLSQSQAPMPEVQPGAIDHSSHEMMEATGLRDPHAYSNGFSRTAGLYALPADQQLHLADEMVFSGLWMERLERLNFDGADATAIEGYAWLGNSYDRFVLYTEAEIVSDSIKHADIDLLWSHAVSPFWNLQMGARQDLNDGPDRTWAAIGFKGLAPYWFELDANFYLGESGRTAIDLEAEYDVLITQKLVLQPRIDIKAFGKSDSVLGRGEGLSTLKSSVRLRYEFSRQFAPYIGVERVANFGETADLLPGGVDRTETHWILGLRFWF